MNQTSPFPIPAAPGMLFLHGGSYVVYAPCDAVYRSLASRLALQCGTSARFGERIGLGMVVENDVSWG